MDEIQIIERLVAEGCLPEAVSRLDDMIAIATVNGTSVSSADDGRVIADLYFRRGKLRWRLGDRSAATSDYAAASALDPTSPAVKALEQARDVADFFNPDLYNP